jgi:protein-tyrosine phosphatase
MFNKIVGKIFIALSLSFLITFCSYAVSFEVTKFPTSEIQGKGPYPYNYRLIDQTIHAGGHPLNPGNWFKNTDAQTLKILNYLKKHNIKTVVDLENTWWIQERYQKLLEQAGLKRLHIPMHSMKVPTKKEWQEIKKAMKEPVYIHCKWGADRTGAVIGRYLVEEKGFSPQEAWEAVITGGLLAGYLGGLKNGPIYLKLKDFIWSGPEQ